jgi:hypothetical protein
LNRGALLALVGGLLLGALFVRTRVELSRGIERARSATSESARGIALCEAARWTLPLGGERESLLEEALSTAERLQTMDPEGARAVAEEVRATLYAVRLAAPPKSEQLDRANNLVVSLLAKRDGLGAVQVEELRQAYAQGLGPAPVPYALSSASFLLWLAGLWLAVRKEGSGRRLGFVLAAVGLAGFVGFIAVA